MMRTLPIHVSHVLNLLGQDAFNAIILALLAPNVLQVMASRFLKQIVHHQSIHVAAVLFISHSASHALMLPYVSSVTKATL